MWFYGGGMTFTINIQSSSTVRFYIALSVNVLYMYSCKYSVQMPAQGRVDDVLARPIDATALAAACDTLIEARTPLQTSTVPAMSQDAPDETASAAGILYAQWGVHTSAVTVNTNTT
jgi:hypothetical protein